MKTNGDVYKKLWDMIRDCRFAMLTTIQDDRQLRGRPMTSLQSEFDGTLWFIAPAGSDAVLEIEGNQNVALAYAESSDADFVSVSGKATIEFDVDRKRKLWNPMVQAWFPQGPESSEVALIRVDVDHADYWDSKSNKIVQMFSFAKALATGAPPKVGEHGSLRL
jgi:general stress protein 26